MSSFMLILYGFIGVHRKISSRCLNEASNQTIADYRCLLKCTCNLTTATSQTDMKVTIVSHKHITKNNFASVTVWDISTRA